MELTVSPITLLFSDGCKRPTLDQHLSHGFLQLQGVKVLMSGLYSGVGECVDQGLVLNRAHTAITHIFKISKSDIFG